MSNRNPTDMGGAFAGVPLCSRESCPSYDGKRCRETGNEPESVCVPEMRGVAIERGAHYETLKVLASVLIECAPSLFQIVHYCSICRAKFASDDEVRAHQAVCVEHPAVKAAAKLRRLLHRALLMAEDERYIASVADKIRKEAGL